MGYAQYAVLLKGEVHESPTVTRKHPIILAAADFVLNCRLDWWDRRRAASAAVMPRKHWPFPRTRVATRVRGKGQCFRGITAADAARRLSHQSRRQLSTKSAAARIIGCLRVTVGDSCTSPLSRTAYWAYPIRSKL